jgi:YlmC/YmxH family sporulation protein
LTDFEINSQTGFVEAFVVPDKNKSFLMSKKNGIRIPWTNIKGIGDDIILVDIKLEV